MKEPSVKAKSSEDVILLAVGTAAAFPFCFALGVWPVFAGELNGGELYVFGSLAFFGFAGSLFFLPKIWSFTQKISSPRDVIMHSVKGGEKPARSGSRSLVELVLMVLFSGWVVSDTFLLGPVGFSWLGVVACLAAFIVVVSKSVQLFVACDPQ